MLLTRQSAVAWPGRPVLVGKSVHQLLQKIRGHNATGQDASVGPIEQRHAVWPSHRDESMRREPSGNLCLITFFASDHEILTLRSRVPFKRCLNTDKIPGANTKRHLRKAMPSLRFWYHVQVALLREPSRTKPEDSQSFPKGQRIHSSRPTFGKPAAGALFRAGPEEFIAATSCELKTSVLRTDRAT